MADTFTPKKGLTYTTYGNTTQMSPKSEFTPKSGQTYYTNMPSGARSATTFSDQSLLGAQTSSLGGGSSSGGGGGSAAPAAQANPQQDQFSAAINDAFNSTMGFLNSAEGNLRSQQGSIEGDINNQYGASAKSLQSNRDISSGEIDRSQEQGGQRKVDALTAARRLYNDLITGGQQRYGGASSAGEAYSALTGRELMRNNQTITSDYNNFMKDIEGARTSLQSKYDSSVAQLEQMKNSALSQAQRDFQDKLLAITQQKASAASTKAQQQLAALQDLRNQVYQINLAQVSGTNSVNQLKQQAETELQSAYTAFSQQQEGAATAGSNFGAATTTNPQTAYSFGANNQASPIAYTGRIKKDEYSYA